MVPVRLLYLATGLYYLLRILALPSQSVAGVGLVPGPDGQLVPLDLREGF